MPKRLEMVNFFFFRKDSIRFFLRIERTRPILQSLLSCIRRAISIPTQCSDRTLLRNRAHSKNKATFHGRYRFGDIYGYCISTHSYPLTQKGTQLSTSLSEFKNRQSEKLRGVKMRNFKEIFEKNKEVIIVDTEIPASKKKGKYLRFIGRPAWRVFFFFNSFQNFKIFFYSIQKFFLIFGFSFFFLNFFLFFFF